MKIIRITTTKTAQERTERAFYNLDFTMTDGALERVVATVYTPESRLDSDPARSSSAPSLTKTAKSSALCPRTPPLPV